MKKLATLGLAIVAMLVVTAVALAQAAPNIQFTGSVTPTSGGTKKKPKTAKLNVKFTVDPSARKTLSTITYFVPPNVKLSGKGFKYCSAEKINAAHTDSVCPKGSRIGSGVAHATLDPTNPNAVLTFNVQTYAGGKNEIAVYLSGAINIAFKAPITSASSPFGQRINVAVPPSVQSPAPSTYSYVTDVTTSIGGKITKKVTRRIHGKKKKVKVTYNFASLTGCPTSKAHQLGVQLGFANNDAGPGGTSEIVNTTSACS